MAVIVEVLSREFVTQSSPTPYSLFELKFSGLDQIYGVTHTPMVFFFEKNPFLKSGKSSISKQLKESLYHSLTKFYPFGGKMNGESSVICNGSGALYLMAQVDATLSDAMKHIPNQIGQYLPLGRSSVSYITEQLVPLAVQVTFFNCGGMAIGFNYSHRISDSWTFATFLSSWAATCRGETHPVVQPEFGLGYSVFPPQDPHLLRELRVTNEEEAMCKKKMVMKMFKFKNQEIMSLKKLASSSTTCPRKNPSPVELVSAFIWKQIIQMKKLKGNSKSKFLAKVEVNLRQQLGDSAMGNFMVSSPVLSTLLDTNDYGFMVGEFQEAFNKMDMGFDCVKYCSDLIEEVKKPEVWSCNFSSLCGFPLYDDVDFGWGKPVLICPKVRAKAAVVLGRAKNGDGIEAWINLSEDDMEILSIPLASQRFTSSHQITTSRL